MLRRFLGSMGLVSKESAAVATTAMLERLLQERDARLAEKDVRVSKESAAVATKESAAVATTAMLERLLQEREARLAEKDEAMRSVLAEKDVRLAEKDVRLAEKDEAMRSMEKACAKDLALARYATDVAESRVGARALLEGTLDGIWAKLPAGRSAGSSTTQQLAGLLKADGPCPGLLAYLRQAAEDNSVKETELLRQVGKLYDVFSERVHAEPAGGVTRVPAELFSGRTTRVGLAALACFSGRDLSLYDLGGLPVPLKLRALRGDCTATQAHLRGSALLEHRVGVKEILS